MVDKRKTTPGKKSSKKDEPHETKVTPPAVNAEQEAFVRVFSAVATRAAIASKLGKSFGGDRDLYDALGYKATPTYGDDYLPKYIRQDVARAAVNAPVNACWREHPRITESEDDETKFEKRWTEIVNKRSVYRQLARVDKLARIGEYAVLLLGFDDSGELSEPVTRASDVVYLQPYGQSNAVVETYDEDNKSERYGLPEKYKLTMKRGHTSTLAPTVHHSRVIHVAEDLLESNVEALPTLSSVLNRLEDLERVVGGSAEMFWRGAFPGYGFKADEGYTMEPQDLSALQDEIEEYMHGMKRYIRLRGMSVEDLMQQVADPSNHADVILTLISCALRIPKRILLGSERGELASSMDEKNWLQVIDDRRRNYCEPTLVRSVVDRLVLVKVLPEPREGYVVEWSDLMAPSDKDKVEVGATRAKAIKDYVSAPGADVIVPPDVFLRKGLGFTQDEIDEVNDTLGSIDDGSEDVDEENEGEEEDEL
jgi:hypothetical protein